MAHQPVPDLVAGVQDLDAGLHILRLRPVGTPVPEDLPHLFGRRVELEGKFMTLHTRTLSRNMARMATSLLPEPDDHFTFGLWTVGNRGRDTFGNETRAPLDPVDSVHHLADIGAYGVSFHDDDLVPPGSTAAEREDILKRFRRALDTTGIKVPMATTNLFSNPVFKEGAFTANDPAVRRWAITKTLDAIDMGVELGASIYVMWGGREGTECDAAKDIRLALDRYKEAVDICCAYSRDRGYDVQFALEPKPNEPRGNILLPTVGHALGVRRAARVARMVGLNPEFADETMSGLSFHHAVAQMLWSGKLFHIDLNGQVPSKYDQDFRFGSEGSATRSIS